jgi:hypothetical protein
MPLTAKGTEIKAALVKEYGEKKGEQVFYAGKNKGTFTGVDSKLAAVRDGVAELERRMDAVASRGDTQMTYTAISTASQSDAACPSDDRQCADCGYPVGDKPVFLGGVWFCATCNPAIF